ncbi:hypothetical protein G6F46_014223 [Rhizopus delemar]|nr:hypothetical protein G6F46_014223 [Rhizopus delemar]
MLRFVLRHGLLLGRDHLVRPPQIVVRQQAVAAGRFAAVVGGQVGRQPVQICARVVDGLAVVDPTRLEPHRLDHVLGAAVAPQDTLDAAQQRRPLADQQFGEGGGIGGHARSRYHGQEGVAHATPLMRISHVCIPDDSHRQSVSPS